MKTMTILSLMAMAVLLGCDKDDDDDNNVTGVDREFTMRAAMGNYAEIDAGKTAAAKAIDAGIREFGQMMVTDHGNAGSELKSIAGRLGLYAPDSLDAEHVALKNQLSTLTGREFDSVYIHAQVKDHQKTIALFEQESDNGNNDELVAFANKTLPHLRHHLHKADSLANNYE